jgi:hypothetical protein
VRIAFWHLDKGRTCAAALLALYLRHMLLHARQISSRQAHCAQDTEHSSSAPVLLVCLCYSCDAVHCLAVCLCWHFIDCQGPKPALTAQHLRTF